MKFILTIILFFPIQICLAQEVDVKFLDSIPLKADMFIGVDKFDNYYYTIGNTLYKKTNSKIYSYTNTQLSKITSVDITNPLKILLFYRGFNSIILLDNRLNELNSSINLTLESFSKNIAFAGISSNNNLWLFSNDDNTLTLWNYETHKIVFESQSLSFYANDFKVMDFKSTYKFCWIVSEKKLLKFNEFGSFLESFDITKGQQVYPFKDHLLLIKNNSLSFLNHNMQKGKIIKLKHEIKSLAIKNNFLYFFNANWLYRYSVLKN